jgi:hypothetical protein
MAQDRKQDRKQDEKQDGGEAAARPASPRPPVGSVDREPTAEPTPQEQGLPVDDEDEPKGHPTSDRFQTEQAHRQSDNDGAGDGAGDSDEDSGGS